MKIKAGIPSVSSELFFKHSKNNQGEVFPYGYNTTKTTFFL